ncbi:hypothetical protein ACN6K9_002053 [Streptomyces sp. SAS_267]|uniref:hypothetical protein n=1 Tax=Streptomyces sp. SAS_267 TaxID=3412750 RepID=UPI00403D3D35
MSTSLQPGGDRPAHTAAQVDAASPTNPTGAAPHTNPADTDPDTNPTGASPDTNPRGATAPEPGRDGGRISRPGGRPARKPRSAPHPLRAEWLRGFAPWAATGLLLALAWFAVAKADQWQGSWGATTELLSTAAALIGVPFALAAGSWQGGRERRRKTAELRSSTARTPLVQLLAAALPLACWLAAAQLLAVAGTLAACAPYASAGKPPFTVCAGNVLTIAACAVLGHAAGRAVPFRLTAPLLAIGGYVVVGALGTQRSGIRYLALCMVHVVGDNDLAVWWYPLVSALWVAGLAAAAALALTAHRRATALLPLAAALGAAVLLVRTGDGLLRDNPLSHRQVCDTSTTPDICVNGTYPGMLPEVTRALSGLTGRLEGVPNLPVRYEDLWRDPHRGEAQLPNLHPIGWNAVRGEVTDPQRYAWEAAHMLVRLDCAEEPSAQRIRVTDEAVLRWLAPDPRSEGMREDRVTRARQEGDTKELASLRAEDTAYARLTAMSADERRDWLGRYFATAAGCGPEPSEVPSL